MLEKLEDVHKIPLPRFGVLFLGYGYYRSHTDQPWFRRRDVVNAMPDSHYDHRLTPSAPRISRLIRAYDAAGFIVSKQTEAGHKGRPTAYDQMSVTPQGEDILLTSLTYSVTNKGETLQELLILPEVNQIVVDEGELVARVLHQICGEQA